MERRRVLVLTSSTGAGHDRHAVAFAEWAAHLRGDRVEVRIEHLPENSSRFLRCGVQLYNAIQRRAPALHHAYFQLVEGLSLLHRDSVAFGRPYYVQLLKSFRPHVILSVHDCLNRGYFSLARRVLGRGTRCVTFCLEFSGGYGFSRNWVNRSADLFLGRTAECAAEGIRRGVPAERGRALGDLFPRRFSMPRLSDSGRAAFLTERLRLPPETPPLLLATGGTGAENHLAFLEVLAPTCTPVVALCGRDGAARARLEAWARGHPHFPLRALAYTDDIPELLQVSAAVVARGGGLAAEALFFGCPIVFNTLGGTMPQELPTIRYFRARQMAPIVRHAGDLGAIVRQCQSHPEEFQSLRRQVAENQPPYDPARLVSAVLGEEAPETASSPAQLKST